MAGHAESRLSSTRQAPDGAVRHPSHPWDDAAEGWSRHTDLIRQWLREPTAALLDGAHIASGQRVLDVAAGAGDQTVDIALRVGPTGTVLATDLSRRILELACERVRADGLAQVQTRQADAQSLELGNNRFDAAVCRLGLMFFDPDADRLPARRRRPRGPVFAGNSAEPGPTGTIGGTAAPGRVQGDRSACNAGAIPDSAL